MDAIFGTWHWALSGFLIGMVMLLLIFLGKGFGMSSNLRSLCSMTGVGKKVPFFDWDWKSQIWNLVVVLGAMLGGYVAVNYLSNDTIIQLNPNTVEKLEKLHIDVPQSKILPDMLFGNTVFSEPKMIAILVLGGFLIGFGSRYAGGCTSGHAITGLSAFQGQSLKAVIGFFVGGLLMVHFILPLVF